MDFSSSADELYGAVPAEFVATRTRLARQAKADGDAALAKRIGALRRPTLPAWAVNLLSRSAADDLGRLLDVGAEMRAAWGSGGGLGDLEQRRARLIRDLVRRAGELAAEAGNPLREQAVREVEDTLQAATVDADVADEVRAGRLSQPRSHTGFVPAGFPAAPRPDGDGRPEPRAERRPEAGKDREQKPKTGKAGAPLEERPAQPKASRTSEERPAKPKAGAPPEGRPAAKPKASRTSGVRARRAESLRKRAEEAERALGERAERAGAAREEAEAASAEVGRLRHELERAVAARDAAVRRAERAEQSRARADEAAREAREAAAQARRAAGRDAGHR
ncbi:hypothetical protein [Actinomadura rubrisoli]|uniref:Uncharacterized protein n=1 Tax=Actinomadura rubrisoli TaxID=2530368 RepID=A0A4R5CFP3_9ACTN|nr:hypothetical protein [Actinomadura rubrisoli]TDD96062.1 hypothetical protein E1298_03715 [Actinomadura rubrisoli]